MRFRGLRFRGLLVLCVMVLLTGGLAACGSDDDEGAAPAEEPAAEEPAEQPAEEPAEEPSEEPAEEPADEPEPTATPEPELEMLDLKVAVPWPDAIAILMVEEVADDLGYYEKHGVNVDFQRIAGSAGPIQLLAGGQVDMASAIFGPTGVDAYQAGDGSMRYIGGYFQRNPLLNVYAATTEIQTGADLEGKTLGVATTPGPSDPAWAFITSVLEANGLTPDDMNYAVTGTLANTPQVLAAGRIDIGLVGIEAVPLIEANPDLHLVELEAPNAYEGFGVIAGMFSRSEVLDDPEKLEALTRYVAAVVDLTRDLHEDPDLFAEALGLVMDISQFDEAGLEALWQQITGGWAVNGMMNLEAIAEYLEVAYYPTHPDADPDIDVTQMADPRVVQGVLDDLGAQDTDSQLDTPGFTL